MYTKKVFSFKDMGKWTRFETLQFLIYSTVITILFYILNLHWLQIPWTPFALIGTAMAFVIGFQNNSAYDRIWEARKIWGGIVNSSRTFGMFVQDMLTNEYASSEFSKKELHSEMKALIYRHIAWMTALRHAMRSHKPWEVQIHEKTNQEWKETVQPPERKSTLVEDLTPYLTEEDMNYVMSKNNKQTALLYLQSHHLRRLKENGMVWEFSFLELENLLKEFFTLQGKSERIKNFPYPRHFASLNHYFVWLFIFILPFGIIPQLIKVGQDAVVSGFEYGNHIIWLSIPICAMLMWVFHTMERIGRTGENPFEGTANDVPISTIARGIEIDLRQNLGESEEDIPEQFPVFYDVQM